LEHNKAMQEQQHKFQKELEELRQALEGRTNMKEVNNSPTQTQTYHTNPKAYIAQTKVTNTEEPTEEMDKMEVEDSSEDELTLAQLSKSRKKSSLPYHAQQSPQYIKEQNAQTPVPLEGEGDLLPPPQT